VKSTVKHPPRRSLQAYFTISNAVFHGKKAANSRGAYKLSQI